MAAWLADAVVVLHLLFVAFVVAGGALLWRWPRVAWLHLPAALWGAATTAQRGRFLRHLRPWWDVHRHRIAPEIAAVLEGLKAANRLTVVAGRAQATASGDGDASLTVRTRNGQARTLCAAWLIDCTGPGHDAARAPLTAALIAEGRARLDAVDDLASMVAQLPDRHGVDADHCITGDTQVKRDC